MKRSISLLCIIAGVSKSGYYKWLKNKDKPPKDYQDYLLIKKVFEGGKKKLGWRTVQMDLKSEHNTVMNHKKIKRIMNHYGLICLVRRKNPYKGMMKKTQEHRVFKNLLNRDFQRTTPRQSLCTDITYLYYGRSSKAYLSVVKDIATGEVLSWEVSQNIELRFVLNTIAKLRSMNLSKNTLLHSDQGAHYTSPVYIEQVNMLGVTQSMSRKGNCIDNAPMESFFGHLKDELNFKESLTLPELTKQINEYMHYYNNCRHQWNLNKMTPVEYRSHLMAVKVA
jgi:putative transposase